MRKKFYSLLWGAIIRVGATIRINTVCLFSIINDVTNIKTILCPKYYTNDRKNDRDRDRDRDHVFHDRLMPALVITIITQGRLSTGDM